MDNASAGVPDDRFDLEERTALFGIAAIKLARLVAVDPVTSPLISQLVRAGTSVGANYAEADEAGSRKEFRYRISLCAREARENTTLGADVGRGGTGIARCSRGYVERISRAKQNLRRH